MFACSNKLQTKYEKHFTGLIYSLIINDRKSKRRLKTRCISCSRTYEWPLVTLNMLHEDNRSIWPLSKKAEKKIVSSIM